ncbi:MAG: acyl-CoA synthetase FdrA [Oscillospiraceae bacterium]
MAEIVIIRKNSYFDSVTLMTLSNKLKKVDGVSDAVVSMATDMNKDLLDGIGMSSAEVVSAGPNDLLIAIRAANQEICDSTLVLMDELLNEKKGGNKKGAQTVFHTISEAKRNEEALNFAIISVKGEFAAREAREAIKNDMHVMLFSDNVTIEQELEIKMQAHEKGLLVMGPDCGTAIIDGVGLCFANKVRSGKIGLVAASGTGLQELTVLVDRLGEGVSQAIGTGGRDLSATIGGIMMLDGLKLLENDEATELICLVSKPPVKEVADKILQQVGLCKKPVVVCFISGTPELLAGTKAVFAANLEDAAVKCVQTLRGVQTSPACGTIFKGNEAWLAENACKLKPEQKYIRGLYCGGTLTSETATEMERALSNVFSNVSKKAEHKMKDPMVSCFHSVVDLGDDTFTVGRPHPMIEPGLRNERFLTEMADPETAVVVMDFELGYGSHEDPVGVSIEVIREAKAKNAKVGREVPIIAYVQGTEEDFQGYASQKQALEAEGVYVTSSNLQAALAAISLVKDRG